jgi:hypothetical protein
VIYLVTQFLDRLHMCLLRDQHGRPWMSLAQLKQPHERIVLDRRAIGCQAASDALGPLRGGDGRQLVERAELAQRALAGPGQVTHQVLDRAREQHADLSGSLETARIRRVTVSTSPKRLLACSPCRGNMIDVMRHDHSMTSFGASVNHDEDAA